MIGIALVLRDLVQRRLGVGMAAFAILFGGLSRGLSRRPRWPRRPTVAFLLSELADMAVYTPLRAAPADRGRGAVELRRARSVELHRVPVARLRLAEFLAGQVVGKAWMVLLSIPFVMWLRRRDEKSGTQPA